jgi:hypothetical protein
VKKLIFFNAFHVNCVVHQSPGLWVHPEEQMAKILDTPTSKPGWNWPSFWNAGVSMRFFWLM